MSYSPIEEVNELHLASLIQRCKYLGALDEVSVLASRSWGFVDWREPVGLKVHTIECPMYQSTVVSQLSYRQLQPVGLVELLRYALLGIYGEPGFWDCKSRVVALGELHHHEDSPLTWAPTIDEICTGRDRVSGRRVRRRRLHFQRLNREPDLWGDGTQFLVQA